MERTCISVSNCRMDPGAHRGVSAKNSITRLRWGVTISHQIKNISSSTIAKSFTLDSNYPERYISYLDIEGHSASIIYGATLVDAEVGSYEGGRQDVSVVSHGVTGEIGVQIFNFQGVHLIRISIEEKSVGK